MYNSFELFFFWHKCSTVVAVGVPDVFFALWMDWLIAFSTPNPLEKWANEKKQCAKCGWIAKSVTEKNNSRVDCAEVGKKTVQALHFDRLSGRQAE